MPIWEAQISRGLHHRKKEICSCDGDRCLLDMLVILQGCTNVKSLCSTPGSCMKVKALVTQSCLTLCDPMDYGPPGSSVHGILQARILEWVYISSFRVSSPPRDQTQGFCIAGRFPFPGMGLMPTAVEAQSLKHWTSREVQIHPFLK